MTAKRNIGKQLAQRLGRRADLTKLGGLVAESRKSLTQLISEKVLDPELAALLWLLAGHGVPIVVAAADPANGKQVRTALRAVLGDEAGLSDAALSGGTVIGNSLEDVLRVSGASPDGKEVDDLARDIGVVLILGERDRHGSAPVLRAHYVRPVERDQGGHFQRRPPALLSAVDERGGLDHFFWAINDELATRTGRDAAGFEREHARRAVVLRDLVAAGVFDEASLRRQIDAAQLASGAIPPDAAN